MDKMGLKEVRCIYKVHVYTFLLVKTNLYTFLYKKVISGIWSFFFLDFFLDFFFRSKHSRYLILDNVPKISHSMSQIEKKVLF